MKPPETHQQSGGLPLSTSVLLGVFVTAALRGKAECRQGWVIQLDPLRIRGESGTEYDCEGTHFNRTLTNDHQPLKNMPHYTETTGKLRSVHSINLEAASLIEELVVNLDRAKERISELLAAKKELEAECDRLHMHWQNAEHRANVEKAEMVKICTTITGHCPRQICTTAEAVEWLVDRSKAATAAILKLEEIRTDKLAQAGLRTTPTAISEARNILRKSEKFADGIADESPERQAYNRFYSYDLPD